MEMSHDDDDDYDDFGAAIRRARSHSDRSSSIGSHQRQCHPEKLIERSRRVREIGTACVDDGAAISPSLAQAVSAKALCLKIFVRSRNTGDNLPNPVWGQVGLIRGERLTTSPPSVSVLRSSRFTVTPVTALHNVATETDPNGSGDVIEYAGSEIVSPVGSRQVQDFERAGFEIAREGDVAVLIRQLQTSENGSVEKFSWKYGHDVTSAGKISNPRSHFTKKSLSFEKMERQEFRFQVGQKIGITVYRQFVVTAVDAGMPPNTLTEDRLREIYGRENEVNVYTGQITHVAPGGNAFEHNINTFAGCSGAIVFLLDRDQDGNGTIREDYSKAIAIHAGGKTIAPGQVTNVAFKL